MEKLRDDHIHPHIERKLLTRLYIFLAISIAIMLYIIREVWIGNIFWLLALAGVCIGSVVGIILGRLMGVAWHKETEKVISKMDTAGAIALVLFIVIDMSREWVFGHWIHGVQLSVFTLCILAGALFGRFLGMRSSVFQVLKEQDIAEGNPEDVI
ncbi:MAG: hypothetical protein JWP09_730 [Candidatus Taylorbacteria bacterium]|nr:hypothetical protein [Candidatus Taylorbacteria bacterium]